MSSFLAGLLLSSVAAAQMGPELHGRLMPATGVEPIEDLPVDTSQMEASIWSWGLSTPTPPITLIEDRWVLINLLAFDQTHLSYEGASFLSDPEQQRDLFRIQWGLLNAWTPSDELAVLLLIQPGLYTDFGGSLNLKDTGGVAMALGIWQFSESFAAGLGVGYVRFFGKPTLTPFLSLNAEAGRFSTSLLLPQNGAVWLELADPLSLGLRGELEGGFYHVHPDEPGYDDAFQEYSQISLGPVLQLSLRDALIIELDGSYAVKTGLEVYEDPDTQLLDLQLEPGWSFGLTLRLGGGGGEEDEEGGESEGEDEDEDDDV